MLPSAKRTLAGTYFAEQVAVCSYDLISASHDESRSPSSTGGSSSARPNAQGKARRRQKAAKIKCTELPSLNSIGLLLDPGDSRAAGKAQQAILRDKDGRKVMVKSAGGRMYLEFSDQGKWNIEGSKFPVIEGVDHFKLSGLPSGENMQFQEEATKISIVETYLKTSDDKFVILNQQTGRLEAKCQKDGLPKDALMVDRYESARDSRREVLDRRAHRIGKISRRLCRGEPPMRRAQDCGTPNDFDVVASLTQPLAFFTKQLASPREMVSRRLAGGARHKSYEDAIEAALAGTVLHMRPRKKKSLKSLSPGRHSPKNKQNTASTGTLQSSQSHSTKSLEIIEVPVLPENAAEAFLRSAELAELEQKWQPQQSEMGNVEERGRRQRESIVQSLRLGNEDSEETQALRQKLAMEKPQALGDQAVGRSSVLAVGAPQQAQEDPASAGVNSPSRSDPERPSDQDKMQAADEEGKDAKTGDGTGNEEVNAAVNARDPLQNVLDGFGGAAKLGTSRKEAAQSLRVFIFGQLTESKKALSPKDIDRALRDKTGSRAQVQSLYAFWRKLDSDRSGCVDIKEFKEFVDAALKDITDGHSRVRGGFSMQAFKDGSPEENARFATQITDRVGQVLLGKKATFVIEDVMRIIWPCSRTQDLKSMKSWFNECELTTWRTKTPPLLPKDQFDALASVFHFFDKDGSGSVTVDELIHSGLMDKEQAQKYVMEVDGPDGDGELCQNEFCELFCPTGFRAHAEAEKGTDEQGQRLVFDKRMNGWRLEEMDPAKAGLFSCWSAQAD
jgi:Ca2+-binding EF-hand superfamily protein